MEGRVNSKPFPSSLVLAIAALVVVSFLAGSWWERGKVSSGEQEVKGEVVGESPNPEQQQGQEPATLSEETMDRLEEQGVVKGEDDAPVRIVLFTDPTCPYCGAVTGGNEEIVEYMKQRDPEWEPSLPNIEKDYVETGKVKLVFRYFPGHGTGEEAMQAMWCAEEEGKFWELHDLVFANQKSVEELEGVLDLASQVGLDREKIKSCVESGKYKDRLTGDTEAGKAAATESGGGFGTPAFFINGRPIIGAYSYAEVKKLIDEELGKV